MHRHSSFILLPYTQLFLSPMNCFSDFEMFWDRGKTLVPTISKRMRDCALLSIPAAYTKLVAARVNWSSKNIICFFFPSFGLSSRLILLVFDYLLLLFVFQFRNGFFLLQHLTSDIIIVINIIRTNRIKREFTGVMVFD